MAWENRPAAAEQVPAITLEQIEADWARQNQLRDAPAALAGGVSPEQDAAGGCDGVKDGKWGFHTEHEDQPWWQVDLGESQPLDRVVLYNRCDNQMGKRNSQFIVLLSNDGIHFESCYQHDGTDFLGHPDGKPCSVPMQGKNARFVRLQLPGKSYFHLDEVEIYAVGVQANVALHKPATQSSTSQWSVAHELGGSAVVTYNTTPIIERGRSLVKNLHQLGAASAPKQQRLKTSPPS